MVLTRWRQRLQEDEGIALVLVALAMVGMLTFAAIVIDVGDARQVGRQAQASSDAAALAGARQLPVTGANPAAAAAAKATAADYAARNIIGSVVAPSPATCPAGAPASSSCYAVEDATITVATPYSGNPGLIYVEVCRDTDATFGQVLGATTATVCRAAVARRFGGTTIASPGVIALDDSAPCFDLRGSDGAGLEVSGAVLANCGGSPPNTIKGSNATIDASAFYSVGSCEPVSACVGSGVATPAIQLTAPIGDPFAGLPEPGATAPGFQHVTVAQYNALPCLDGHYRVTGTGNVVVKGTCPGATSFTFLVSAGLSDNVKTVFDQHPPTSGPYAGISLFVARGNTSTISWNGNAHSAVTYHGTVYAPDAHIDWGGNIDVLVYGQVIARSYNLHGGGGPKNLGFKVVPPADVPPVQLADDIGLEL